MPPLPLYYSKTPNNKPNYLGARYREVAVSKRRHPDANSETQEVLTLDLSLQLATELLTTLRNVSHINGQAGENAGAIVNHIENQLSAQRSKQRQKHSA